MSAIRITELPLLSDLQDRDLVNFQRLVDGVWTDFHTDGATLQGAVRTFIQPVDLSDSSSATVYAPDTDELAIPLAMWMVYTPDATPSGLGFSAQAQNATGTTPLDISIFSTDSVSGVYNAIDSGIQYDGLDSDLILNWVTSGANGTGIIFVQYAVVPKV